MTREEYQELYNDDETMEITLPYEFIHEWLDNLVDALNTVISNSYSLHYGKFSRKRGEFSQHIEPCSAYSSREFHIYRGIDRLAEVCGEQLQKVTDTDMKYPVKLYFYYKGIKFFELREQEANDKQDVPEGPQNNAEA